MQNLAETSEREAAKPGSQTGKARSSCSGISAVDLFAGAGGFSLAATELGLNLVGAIELDPIACKTYRRNFCKNEGESDRESPLLFPGDIRQISPTDIRASLGLVRGELDILIGGPPCQGFSEHRLGDSGRKDPRNELLIRYFDFVQELRPKYFVVENVRGLLWQKHRDYLLRFYDLASSHGYTMFQPQLLDAKDYGVPQTRERVFLLGRRNDQDAYIEWPPKKTHGPPSQKELPPWITAGAVFEKEVPSEDRNNQFMQPGPVMLERFKQTPANGGGREHWQEPLRCHVGHNGHWDVYGRIDPSRPANTITTGCTNPSRGRFVHPTEHHGLAARHCARLQTFPDNFVFEGSLEAVGRQIGNAVPIELGKAVLNVVISVLGGEA